jgi:homocysteine S-methyltransferase
MQSAIMGLAAQGLFNVLAVTGDPPPQGGEDRVSGVFDVRSFELISLLKGFAQGRNASGQDMKANPPLCVGGAFNPNTRDISMQVGRMRRKIERGAEYFLTQPVYSPDKLERILEATRDVEAPIFLGIMPLASHRNAEYLHNEFPGISIPDEIRERMRKAGEHGAAEGIEIAWELMAQALPHFAGIYLMPPFNRHAAALELVRRARAAFGHGAAPQLGPTTPLRSP